MTRKSDIVCRFGGEEFLVLFPETGKESAFVIAEKIRMHLKTTPLFRENGERLYITISAGVSECNSKKDTHIENIISRADTLMYKAKKSGKNQTCM